MSEIHKSSVVSEKAKLGKNVKIGPFCLIGDNVTIEDNVVLHSHVVIEGITRIGEGTRIFPFASIGHQPQDLKYEGENSEVIIGKNNSIREYVTIQPGTKNGIMKTIVGDNCLLMAGTHIAHDCVIGNNIIFANLATIAGHVIIEDHVVIGGLAAVHQHVRIGAHAMIGGLAAVVRDVVPFAAVSGERAAIEGMNLLGLKRRGFDKGQILDLHKAFNQIFFASSGDISSGIEFAKNNHQDNPLVKQLLEFLSSDSKRSFVIAKNKNSGD